MNQQMPRTPFSTGLSGSARETEIRLRNIFAGPKKRPPLPFLILMFAIAIFCGNLVSCRQRPPEPSLVMETQYYDRNDNYIEIPALALPAGEENDAVDAINAALNDLRSQYGDLLDNSYGFVEEQCLFYPSTTDRYLNLLFFRSQFTTDLNTGHVFSLVYDKREGTLVSTGDALALAGLNEKGLLDQVAEQMEPEMNPEGQGYQIALHNLTLEGFRVKADGQPVFYLTGRMDDVDDAVLDAVSGADQLFIWEDRVVSMYAQYGLEKPALVPAEETDQLDPPLWNQWYFAGEEPAGGFVDKPLLEPEYVYIPGEDPYGNNFFSVLLNCYIQYSDEWNVFYAPWQEETDKAGDLRVTPTYLGEIPWGEDTCAAAYQVCYTFYIDGPQGLEWHANFEDIVLERSTKDGEFTGLLARMDYEDRMRWMTAEEIIQEATGG